MPRTVSIAGHREDLAQGLKELLDGVEQRGFGSWEVTGNGDTTPDFELELTVEPHEEFTEPVADYGGE